MTGHPKICPLTGELHLISYDFAPPYFTYHVADPTGRLCFGRTIDIPAPVMMHDFCLTEHHVRVPGSSRRLRPRPCAARHHALPFQPASRRPARSLVDVQSATSP